MTTEERPENPAPQQYEAPRVETVISSQDLLREVQYAGRASDT